MKNVSQMSSCRQQTLNLKTILDSLETTGVRAILDLDEDIVSLLCKLHSVSRILKKPNLESQVKLAIVKFKLRGCDKS